MAILEADRPGALSTRWINIWHPSKQTSLLQLLAKRYDFTPRLLALMCSDPKALRTQSTIPHIKKASKTLRCTPVSEPSLEEGLNELSEASSITSDGSVYRANLYKITNDIWHYSSIDFGRNYVCIGYNSIYGTQHGNEGPRNGPLPHCTRVWTWLVLCKDNTVISINEDPFPFSDGPLNTHQKLILGETRRNISTIFRSLSTADESALKAIAPMSLLPLRARLGSTREESANRLKDTPSLLFYYLFENWHNGYTLITRKESRYGLELNALRAAMFRTPKLAHIDRLDTIGRELGVLKRHYESYDRLIDRLLEPQPASAASIQNMRLDRDDANGSRTSLSTIRPIATPSAAAEGEEEKESSLGVSLPTPARVRFTRLRDSIDLYALSEVGEYLAQKDRLIGINFQLIAIKESQDVEKLTRITLLLTKCTILFLPVSFLTSYFSAPLGGTVYSVQEYWVAFALTLGLSALGLFLFGVVSGSVQTISVFRATGRALRRAGRWGVERL